MVRFLFLSFAFLGWAFFEVSGGADFEPETPERIARFEALEAQRAEAARQAEQARRAAIAEKARRSEADRAAMRLASLTFDSSGATTGGDDLAALPLTRRHTLVSQPVATPPDQRADLTPGEEALRAAEAEAAAAAALPEDIRAVRGSRVNMRGGPGTSYAVLGKLERGDEVKVLKEPGNGWVKLKVIDTGRIGWMSAKLLKKLD